MSRPMKHIAKLKNTGSKVVVVFRTIPGESDRALILETATLPDSYHDSLMNLIESDQGQDSYEFGEIMFTRSFPDGRNMLTATQHDNRLKKVPTDLVLMTPTPSNEISLDQLNAIIAEQKNCSIDDLCTFVSGGNKNINKDNSSQKDEILSKEKELNPMNDKDLARDYRSKADALYKEAAKLRKQADELDPPQKKSVKAKETIDA